jgi:hypothetical protein
MSSDEKTVAALLPVSSDREGQIYVECMVPSTIGWCTVVSWDRAAAVLDELAEATARDRRREPDFVYGGIVAYWTEETWTPLTDAECAELRERFEARRSDGVVVLEKGWNYTPFDEPYWRKHGPSLPAWAGEMERATYDALLAEDRIWIMRMWDPA